MGLGDPRWREEGCQAYRRFTNMDNDELFDQFCPKLHTASHPGVACEYATVWPGVNPLETPYPAPHRGPQKILR